MVSRENKLQKQDIFREEYITKRKSIAARIYYLEKITPRVNIFLKEKIY